MTTHSFFCDEEVGILQHLLLSGEAESDYFRAFSPRSFSPKQPPPQQQQQHVTDSTTREQARLAPQGLATPLHVADTARMGVQDPAPLRIKADPRGADDDPDSVERAQWRALKPINNAMNTRKDATAATRTCLVVGCSKSSQSHGRCIRHGGGRRCSVPNCKRGAQTTGRCKAHGGGVRCSVVGCRNSSQGAGLCRTHGGGKLCVFPGCKKGTQRRGRCSTHGGSRRCTVSGCVKIDRGGGYCGAHKKALAAIQGTY